MTFDLLGLAPELLRAVAEEGYTEPTPVQRQAIPPILAGRDVLAAAQTGTGKTAAFVLPILQRLHQASAAPRRGDDAGRGGAGASRGRGGARRGATGRPVRVLVLAPTRELALQVEESFRTYGRHRPSRSVAIYGGVGFEPQVRGLRAGPPVVVATPGRLLDHTGQGTIDLSHVEVLVLDEADRMLDMGFIRDIRRVLALLPAERQNLLFSATFSAEIRSLATGLLDRPVVVDASPRVTAAELVDQLVIPVDRQRKRELLSHLVGSRRVRQALVFTRTKHGANRLAEQLVRDGIRAAAIHGNKSQSQRLRALADFKGGRVDLLVATDIAARGLDIEGLPHVVNFELPMVPSDYVHRIGRTGRAGVGGSAISLVCVDEAGLLRDIEAQLRRSLPSEIVAGFEPDRSIRAEPIRLRSGEGRGNRPTPGFGSAQSGARSRGGRTSVPHPPPRTRRSEPGRTARPVPGNAAHGLVALPGERLSRTRPANSTVAPVSATLPSIPSRGGR
jgi:ATP-dependent RNA helicase RhlE